MHRRVLHLVLAALLTTLACGGSEEESQADRNAHEYQMIQAELKLSELEKPYLVLSFDEKQLRLKLKGTVVWDFPIDIEQTDSDEIADFVERFRDGHRLVRPVTATHLYEYKKQTPDSILAIISEVTKFSPDLLQRKLPSRFELHWGDQVILDIRTGIEGQAESSFKNTLFGVRQVLQNPLGAAEISVKMDSVHAMTLWEVAQPGLQTIVQPPLEG